MSTCSKCGQRWVMDGIVCGCGYDKAKRKAKRKEAPDWFGCGKTITQESWNRFLAARKAYYEQQEAK